MFPEYDSNNPKLLESFVCFADILGFSEFIKSTPENQKAQLLLDLHSHLSQCYEQIKEENVSGFANFKTFTDNIVLAYPRHEDGEGQLGNIISSISKFQLNMISEGYFVRGGISLGDYYGDDIFAYGPALLEAHDLESIYANHPRIIISEKVAYLITQFIRHFYGGSHAPQSNEVLLDLEDNIFFINYLECLEDGLKDDLSLPEYLNKVMKHKEKIEEALDKFYNNPKVMSKYSWVGKYHNHFCDIYLPAKAQIIDIDIEQYKISSLSSGSFESIVELIDWHAIQE